MARSRNIKPALFKNEVLGAADPLLTILFIGLWGLADRDGRLEDRPLRIKAEILPYREIPSFNGYLTELERLEFICRYKVDGKAYIQVLKFDKHQNPHKTEKASEIPPCPESYIKSDSCPITVKEPLNNDGLTEPAVLIPDSLNTDSLIKMGKQNLAEKPKDKRFKKPTVDEVRGFCQERSNSVDAERFINHYESNGWKVGKNPMKDWKAAVRTWERRDEKDRGSRAVSKPCLAERATAARKEYEGRDGVCEANGEFMGKDDSLLRT